MGGSNMIGNMQAQKFGANGQMMNINNNVTTSSNAMVNNNMMMNTSNNNMSQGRQGGGVAKSNASASADGQKGNPQWNKNEVANSVPCAASLVGSVFDDW